MYIIIEVIIKDASGGQNTYHTVANDTVSIVDKHLKTKCSTYYGTTA